MDSEPTIVDEYDHYDYDREKVVPSKSGRNRAKNEMKHNFSTNRSDRIHIDNQNNNRDKQMEAARKKLEADN
ncbi:hypothetical protein ECG_00721 [Echinococcus granulosus]|uniref:Expressed conserved protein n=1 Tax=Echinococcus granulosus TaxID=6210 RepID=A0A068WFN4_ECHGR|nr:hypothetical protein ECG_00721 [Echinococcus granulosus]CDS16419.1 hypothetical protein EgrG_000884400 [Echinococcus granulosus]